jgi:hypothetical protein
MVRERANDVARISGRSVRFLEGPPGAPLRGLPHPARQRRTASEGSQVQADASLQLAAKEGVVIASAEFNEFGGHHWLLSARKDGDPVGRFQASTTYPFNQSLQRGRPLWPQNSLREFC